MKKVLYLISAVLLAVALLACNSLNRKSHTPGEPDIVNASELYVLYVDGELVE